MLLECHKYVNLKRNYIKYLYWKKTFTIIIIIIIIIIIFYCAGYIGTDKWACQWH